MDPVHSDVIYVNCNINSDDRLFIPARYDVTYDSPLISNPKDYFLSVVKFSIPLQQIPLLIPPIVPDQFSSTVPGTNDGPILNPLNISKYNVGTASQAANIITGIGPNFTPDMIGSWIKFQNGVTAEVTGFTNPTTLTVTQNQVVIAQPYELFYGPNPNHTFIDVGISSIATPTTRFQRPVIWETQNLLTTPSVQNQELPVITPYYYLYNYSHYTKLVSEALEKAWVDAGSPGNFAPKLLWNQNNQNFEFQVDLAMVDAGFTVSFDEDFYSFIPGFNVDQVQNREYNLIIEPSPLNFPEGGGPGAADNRLQWPTGTLIVKPDFNSIDYFSSFRRLIIASNSLPAQKEYYPILGSAKQSGFASTLGIISDFQIDVQKPGQQTGVAVYDANLYRLVDLISDYPIRKIDLQLYWTDVNNNLYPLFLTPYQNVNIKLGFFHKKLYEQ
jgi:hypothetical protein